MILLSLVLVFSFLQSGHTTTSENLVQPDDPRVTRLQTTQSGCSEQNNLRPFSLTRVQKCTEVNSANDYNRTFASVFVRAKAKRLKLFAALQLFKKLEYFLLKMLRINGINIIRWTGILTPCHYLMNWIQNIVRMLSETLMERIVLNWSILRTSYVSIFLALQFFITLLQKLYEPTSIKWRFQENSTTLSSIAHEFFNQIISQMVTDSQKAEQKSCQGRSFQRFEDPPDHSSKKNCWKVKKHLQIQIQISCRNILKLKNHQAQF